MAIILDKLVFAAYFSTGLVPNFPTLIMSNFILLTAILLFNAVLILETLVVQDRQELGFRLQMVKILDDVNVIQVKTGLYTTVIAEKSEGLKTK